jgi:oligoendopeptidase F
MTQSSFKMIPTEWDLSPLMSGDDDPKLPEILEALKEAARSFVVKWKDRDDYLSDPKILREALDEYETWQRESGTWGNPGFYFHLRREVKSDDPNLKAKESQVQDLATKLGNDMQFFTHRIAKLPEDRQAAFLNSPDLAPYRHFLERSFVEAKYLLSEAEEKVVNLYNATSYGNWTKMNTEFISREERDVLAEDGQQKTVSFSELTPLMRSQNKEVRDGAALAMQDIVEKNLDVSTWEINSVLAHKKVADELRGFDRPDRGRHIGDDIDTEAVDAMVGAVSSRFDISERFYDLLAALNGLPKLAYHEKVLGYGSILKKYTYEEAAELVLRTFEKLDSEFGDIFRMFVEGGHIDAMPRKGKRDGAFCSYVLLSQPTYILLNHSGTMHDVLTIAHEAGHGINNELIKKAQHALNFGTPVSTAEVASTFMEDFVLEELSDGVDDETRLAILIEKLSGDIATIFRQVAFYRFEQELHAAFREKGFLSKEAIGDLFQKHMSSYLGKHADGARDWWTYIPHFRYYFYVYSYASGLLISKSLQREVRQDKGFIGKVKMFLATGTSESPKEIFSKLGIDIADEEFWNAGLAETERLLKEAEDLAKKLGKV